jgi:hypothetical protein
MELLSPSARQFLSLCLMASVLCVVGCERHKAQERVLESINAKGVRVTNGQVAVLRLNSGYAVLVPNSVQHNEIRFRVFTSTNGNFQASDATVQESIATTTIPVNVGNVRIFVGYGGENATAVMLDFGDHQTGLALFPTNDPRLLDISKIEFKQGKPLNPEDLMKAIGKK